MGSGWGERTIFCQGRGKRHACSQQSLPPQSTAFLWLEPEGIGEKLVSLGLWMMFFYSD